MNRLISAYFWVNLAHCPGKRDMAHILNNKKKDCLKSSRTFYQDKHLAKQLNKSRIVLTSGDEVKKNDMEYDENKSALI